MRLRLASLPQSFFASRVYSLGSFLGKGSNFWVQVRSLIWMIHIHQRSPCVVDLSSRRVRRDAQDDVPFVLNANAAQIIIIFRMVVASFDSVIFIFDRSAARSTTYGSGSTI
jgi:hypothetical protein